MHPVTIPNVYAWSHWQPDRKMFFTSHLLVREGGNVVVDPLPLDEHDQAEIAALGGVATILLTNRDHQRDAGGMRKRFGARILSSRTEADLFELAVDGVFECAVPAIASSRSHARTQVLPGISAFALEGAKTPGEVAFVLDEHAAAIVGDALLGVPAGALAFLPDSKLADPQALALSLRRLWSLRLKALLLGDGASLFSGVDETLGALLETRGGPEANRINLDQLDWEAFDDANGRYKGEDAEIGLPIGARRLGYRAVRLPPGARFCPLHSHDKEEEVFYVIDGEPSVRTPRGTLRLRPGDFMAFPVGDRGAHQLLNESGAPCTVLLFGMDDPDDVAYYPDSRKVLVCRRDFMMREDRLDYYDGE
jgi:uncharacterized cupin superfamily protein